MTAKCSVVPWTRSWNRNSPLMEKLMKFKLWNLADSKYQCQFFNCDKCIMVFYDITNEGTRMKGVQELCTIFETFLLI